MLVLILSLSQTRQNRMVNVNRRSPLDSDLPEVASCIHWAVVALIVIVMVRSLPAIEHQLTFDFGNAALGYQDADIGKVRPLAVGSPAMT